MGGGKWVDGDKDMSQSWLFFCLCYDHHCSPLFTLKDLVLVMSFLLLWICDSSPCNYDQRHTTSLFLLVSLTDVHSVFVCICVCFCFFSVYHEVCYVCFTSPNIIYSQSRYSFDRFSMYLALLMKQKILWNISMITLFYFLSFLFIFKFYLLANKYKITFSE